MRLAKLLVLSALLWHGAAAQTIVATTKPLSGGWFPTDFASYEVRLTGRKATDAATANKIIGRIALKTLSFSLLTQRVTILVPANEVWEIKGMTMHFVPINTTGIRAFDIPLIDFAVSFFPAPGQVLAIDVDVKTGNVMMGPVGVVAPPVIVPPPPPPVGISPDGSKITPASGGSLTTAAGVWTFGTATGAGGNVILLNGAQAASGEATELYVLNGSGLYAFNTFSNWFQWNGTSWNRLPVAPAGAPHP